MPRDPARIERAAQTHRRAAALAAAAGAGLAGHPPQPGSASAEPRVRELVQRLRAAATRLAPDGSGDPGASPRVIQIGTGYPLADAGFPVLVPLGHLALDRDAGDARVAGVLQAVLLRLLAPAPPGSLLVRAVDPAGTVCPPFAPLHDAGILPPPAIDRAGLRELLAEAEQWVRVPRADPELARLLVIAAWPDGTGPAELARLPPLAAAGPATGLHLLVAGWPPAPPEQGWLPAPPEPAGRPEQLRAPLAQATQVWLRHRYAAVGPPPGDPFGDTAPPDPEPTPGRNVPVLLDPPPPAEQVARVGAELAGRLVGAVRVSFGELLPDDPLCGHDARPGLAVVVGRSGDARTVLRLGDATPHWLVVGRSGSGKTSLLLDLLYGLASRYRPDQLGIYLLDLTGRGSFAEFTPSGTDPAELPHARAVLVKPDRQEALAVLRQLAARLHRPAPRAGRPIRAVCIVDGIGRLLAGADPVATEAAGRLRAIAEQGGPHGVHLVLAGRTVPPEPIAARCRVRIALPGGGAALDPANHAAASLALGTGVVNTAGGLGGPRGATRAHERLVRFPDPSADQTALAGLRYRLWRAAGGAG